MTTIETLEALQTEIKSCYNMTAAIEYARNVDTMELTTTRRLTLQPASIAVQRATVADPRRVFVVNLISEERAPSDGVEQLARDRVAEMEIIANGLTRAPKVGGAFVLSAKTFSDSPAFVNLSITEDGYALILAGLQIELIEN